MPPRVKNPGVTRASRKRGRSIGGEGSSCQSSFDVLHFSSAANEQWYFNRFNNTVLVEIDIDDVFDAQHHFHDLFVALGSECMFNLPNKYYPSLVCQFYGNMEHKTPFSASVVDSYVKGL